ncbi:hypothetical protein J437_LFUL013847 [Ladona fulva]|uniref:Citrate synthase n=1 Tax=Ladona fulva TaxID=123851 RepID=A0A8K0KJ14_LADFU|nr:hypothetical protein J437_LFUL013847 [Ladona fulva]
MALFRLVSSRVIFSNQVNPSLCILLRGLSAESTDLREVLSKKIPQEQERIKAFRQKHGGTKVGDVTIDMVSNIKPSAGFDPYVL